MAANANPDTTNVYTSAQAPNKFGAPPNNSNRQPLSANSKILTQDYTGRALSTPDATQDVVSPTATLTTNALALQIPPNAVSMTMISTAAFNFSEFGPAGAPLTQSVVWPANTPVKVEVTRQKFMYVTGTAALSFFFQTL
jgi:ABC-type Fe3+-hydroxamate transport system substrate-binding protein